VNRHRMLGLLGKISEKCGLDLCANDRQILPLILIYWISIGFQTGCTRCTKLAKCIPLYMTILPYIPSLHWSVCTTLNSLRKVSVK